MKTVTVIMPCRNEAARIGDAIRSLLDGGYPRDRMQLIVVDGGSEDGTREIVARFPDVRLIDNPGRIVPAALNIGVRNSSSEIVMRADAHAVYPPGYLSTLVGWLERTGADNVGCALETLPGGTGVVPRSIALVLSHPFGIGDARFRLGTDKPIEVDTVPFGCYRREVFDRIGLFDEELVRNQDDEFNWRLRRAGGRIVLVPGLRVCYFARSRFQDLWRMAWGYGSFKPLVLRKVSRLYAARPLAPGALAIAALVWAGRPNRWTVIPLLAYACVNAAASRGSIVRSVGFATLHLGYGFGLLWGARRIAR